jgi:predicted glycogen debranching enzyme
LARTLLVAKLEETARYRGLTYELGTNRWRNDYIAPRGFELIEGFYLDGTTPVWEYAIADALIEKRIWMQQGENVTFARYRLMRAAEPVNLRLRALVNYRDFHGNTHAGDWHVDVTPCDGGMRIAAYDGAMPFSIVCERGDVVIENVWYRDFVLAQETRRGLDDRDDNLCAGSIAFSVGMGESVTVAMGVGDPRVILRQAQHDPGDDDRVILSVSKDDSPPRTGDDDRVILSVSKDDSPPWFVSQLKLAAEQFIVARPTRDNPNGKTIIAGYHWFGDWGRDTMISLPGLTLATGRHEVAREILLDFAPYVDGGMLPNFFPETGQTPAYNTVDAALWFVEAAAAYIGATADAATLRKLWPSLQAVVAGYRDGTRYGICMDEDGAIVASASGLQLTWMDAKVGDWVVTPRMGKPVEIAALWHNALERMTALAALVGEPAGEYAELARCCRVGFERFWNAAAGYCYDVIDGPDGGDASLRPNQIFAVSLPHSPLTPERQRAVVDVCAAQLLTSNGLRTLAPSDPRFVATYGGPQHDRDAAYHQGTVWPWLLGPFAIAYARVYGDNVTARSFLELLAAQLLDHGLGTISEIADGSAPFNPNGAIAQAWSVAEFLRAWAEVGEAS